MAGFYDDVPENPLRVCAAENMRLKKEIIEVTEELKTANARIVQLQGLLTYYKEKDAKGEKMGLYVEKMRIGHFRPAYKKDISHEVIVRVMVVEGITNLAEIGERLGVSYATVRRRLIEAHLFPINMQDVREYHQLFGDD